MKIGDRVTTPHGTGIIIGYDLPESRELKRYQVKLDVKKFDFNPCYWLKELEKEGVMSNYSSEQYNKAKEVLIDSGKICPYCGKKTEYIDSLYVYGGRSYGMIYICKSCDAYVGVHKGTDKALGRLANRELRRAKMQAHENFDPLWQGNKAPMKRTQAYKWLAEKLRIEPELCHIGMFDIEQCNRVVEVCRENGGQDG